MIILVSHSAESCLKSRNLEYGSNRVNYYIERAYSFSLFNCKLFNLSISVDDVYVLHNQMYATMFRQHNILHNGCEVNSIRGHFVLSLKNNFWESFSIALASSNDVCMFYVFYRQ